MKGLITALQRMSIHDGPGIRTVVFMKGCNMRCKWCHNPETWTRERQIQYIREKCIHCLTCLHTCPEGAVTEGDGRMEIDRKKCSTCGLCTQHCYAGALSMVGREVSPEELWVEIEQDLPFFEESHGGVTVSGGEPLMQQGFVREFLGILKENGVPTAVETNASFPWECMEELLPLTDLWLCDLKLSDDRKHREWTGIGNGQIVSNLKSLAESGAKLCVRTPVVPGVNDSEEEIAAICSLLEPIKDKITYQLLGFHTLGFGKYDSLGMDNAMAGLNALPEKRLEELQKITIHG